MITGREWLAIRYLCLHGAFKGSDSQYTPALRDSLELAQVPSGAMLEKPNHAGKREEMHVTDHRAMSTCPSSPVPDLNLSTHCSVSTESTCKDTKLMMRINWPLVWQYLRTRRLIWRWQRMMMMGRRDRLLEIWLDKDMDWLEGLFPVIPGLGLRFVCRCRFFSHFTLTFLSVYFADFVTQEGQVHITRFSA